MMYPSMTTEQFSQFVSRYEHQEYIEFNPQHAEVQFNAEDNEIALAIPGHGVIPMTANAYLSLTNRAGFPKGMHKKIQQFPHNLFVPLVNHALRSQERLSETGLTVGVAEDHVASVLLGEPPIGNLSVLDIISDVMQEPELQIKHVTGQNGQISFSVVIPNLAGEVKNSREVGDVIHGGIRVENSYSGDSPLQLAHVMYRLTCTNGAVSPDITHRRTIRNTEEDAGFWVRNAVTEITDEFSNHMEQLATIQAMTIAGGDLNHIISSMFSELDIPHTAWAALMKMIADEPPTSFYDLYNILTWYASNSQAAMDDGKLSLKIMKSASRLSEDPEFCDHCHRLMTAR